MRKFGNKLKMTGVNQQKFNFKLIEIIFGTIHNN